MNGSGKSSLLEAIHLLAVGRSFRSRMVDKVVRHGERDLAVFGIVSDGEREHRIGLRKGSDGIELRMDGERCAGMAPIAALLPVQVMAPGSQVLLEGGPKERRGFIDWGVFHVEPGFGQLWNRYRRLLEQRNAWLRSGARGTGMEWSSALAETGVTLNRSREGYLERFGRFLGNEVEALLGLSPEALELVWRRGWPAERELGDVFVECLDRDRALAHTGAGPHRAELRVRVRGTDAVDLLSRGELKMLVASFRLAQGRMLSEEKGSGCLFLVDDVAAELDGGHRAGFLEALAATGMQAVVTSLDEGLVVPERWPSCRRFHVEHGHVREVV